MKVFLTIFENLLTLSAHSYRGFYSNSRVIEFIEFMVLRTRAIADYLVM